MSKIVRYQNAYYSNYKINYDQDLAELQLRREDTDYQLLEDKCLITVCGYPFRCENAGDYLRVRLRTQDTEINQRPIFRRNFIGNVGILSFNALANPITTIPLVEAMIVKDIDDVEGFEHFNSVFISVPYACQNPFLVMGGYIQQLESEVFTMIDQAPDYTTFRLKLVNTPFIERLYELGNYRNILEELGINTADFNNQFFTTANATYEDVIVKFLTLSNSFIVDVPIESMTITPLALDRTTVPGSFRTQREPLMPLIVGYGKLTDYWKKRYNDAYNIYVGDWYYNHYLFANPLDLVVVNNTRRLEQTHEVTQAFFLEMTMSESV